MTWPQTIVIGVRVCVRPPPAESAVNDARARGKCHKNLSAVARSLIMIAAIADLSLSLKVYP